MCDIKEIRDWIQLAFVIVGGLIALAAFFQNLRQRRLENALKVIGLFRDALRDGDLEHWQRLFHSSSKAAGAKPGTYVHEWDDHRPISDYFSEGAPDNGAVARMAENLEILCHELIRKTIDPHYVWFELGQLLRTMYDWLSCTSNAGSQSLISQYPSIDRAFKKYGKNFAKWPSRVYADVLVSEPL